MRIRTLKLAQKPCFARAIRLEVEGRLKRDEAQTTDIIEAAAIYKELLEARRLRAAHENMCPVCRADNRRHGPKPQMSFPGLRPLAGAR